MCNVRNECAPYKKLNLLNSVIRDKYTNESFSTEKNLNCMFTEC